MKVLITGASSGIGKQFALTLSNLGYELILVSRNLNELNKLKKQIKTNCMIINLDLSEVNNCFKLYEEVKDIDIDIIINNAGFGVFGNFSETKLEKELEMINVNINAVHILTKLFYKKFKLENKGYILNVSSLAAFQPGPLMAAYYASKSYVYNLSCAIYEEIRRDKSNVRISVLCPGPVKTNFNNVIGIHDSIKGLSSKYVCEYAIKKMYAGKLLIIPGFTNRLVHLFEGFLPLKILLKITYNIQKKKVS